MRWKMAKVSGKDSCRERLSNYVGASQQEVDSGGGTFTTAKINPQGQLCLSLNRPHTFHKCIKEILTKANSPCDNIAHDQTLIITDHEQLMTGSPHHHRRQPSVSDGRIILVKQLVSQILSQNGHKTRNVVIELFCL